MTVNALQMVNIRPRNRTGGDCVVLALTFATGQPYSDVEDFIRDRYRDYMAPGGVKAHGVRTDQLFKDEFVIYSHKLVRVYNGYKAFLEHLKKNPVNYNPKIRYNYPHSPKFSIADFIRQNPTGTFIVCVKRHALVIKDGQQYDACDTNQSTAIENVWEVVAI